jgi:hypothetical protein
LDFTPHSGYSPAGVNFEISGADPGYNATQNVAKAPILDNCGKMHLVLTWDSVAGSMAVYTNGALMSSNGDVALPISAIVNAHSYLGKSSYSGDPYGVATIDELRMYSGAMSLAQIAADIGAGPNSLPQPSLQVATSGQNLLFSWPGYISGYSVETTAELGTNALWTPVSNAQIVFSNGVYSVCAPVNNQKAFYRLVKQ